MRFILKTKCILIWTTLYVAGQYYNVRYLIVVQRNYCKTTTCFWKCRTTKSGSPKKTAVAIAVYFLICYFYFPTLPFCVSIDCVSSFLQRLSESIRAESLRESWEHPCGIFERVVRASVWKLWESRESIRVEALRESCEQAWRSRANYVLVNFPYDASTVSRSLVSVETA